MRRKRIIEPHRSIADIDRDIRANRLALLRRQKVRRKDSADDWQAAWDAEPQIYARCKALWTERGFAQIGRCVPADRLIGD